MGNSDIEIYFKSHPDATVKEYLDYVKAKNIEKREAENERQEKCIEWYKSLEGRCFLISFHSNAHIVLKVTKCPNAQVTIYFSPSIYPFLSFLQPKTLAKSLPTEGFSASTKIFFIQVILSFNIFYMYKKLD